MPEYMSDEEIRASYRNAKYQKRQIRILAQLNLCSIEEIEKIIGKENTEMARLRYPADTDNDIIRLWNEGEKIKGISERLGIPLGTLKNKIQALHKSKKIEGRKQAITLTPAAAEEHEGTMPPKAFTERIEEKEMPASAGTDTDISAEINPSTDILHPESDFVKSVSTENDNVAKALDEVAAKATPTVPNIGIATAVLRLEFLEIVIGALSEFAGAMQIDGKYADNHSGRSEISFTAGGEAFVLQMIRRSSND